MIRDIRIGLRTMFAFGLLGLITLLVGVFSILQLAKLNDTTDVLALHRIPAISTVGELRRDLLLTQVVINELSDSKTQQEITKQKKRIADITLEYEESEKKMSVLSKSKESNLLLSKVIEQHDDLVATLPTFFSLLKIGDMDDAVAYKDREVMSIARELRRTLDEFANFQTMRAAEDNDDATSTYSVSKQLVISCLVFGLLITALLAYLYSKSLIVPLQRAVDIAKKIAGGDLTQNFSDEHQDEAAEMLTALRMMQNKLQDAMSRIADSSNQLASTSEELNAVTSQSSEIVVQQSDQISIAASSVSQLTSAIEEVARTASSTSASTGVANEKTLAGKVLVSETIKTIELLKLDIENSEHSVNDLADNIKSITAVLDVIRGIAEQTNLLALNAAIEAARAGENGRGFAVVADEVRALAHRTQQSTKDIEDMISSVGAGVQKTVESMSKSNQLSTSTLTVANETGIAFEEILALIIEINNQSATIASAAEQQATVAKEVDGNLIQIKDLSLQTSVGADQTAASSAELAKLASHMNELVLKFKF
ncbi:methyl-accepting chemotaxis protein [Pseudoalteromonas sp.]|uniref:methyl-accepting chemotaxis protein n=1 Tax=Pseudoalteromonas sp. TaxID=53249 RepID=UPI0035686316